MSESKAPCSHCHRPPGGVHNDRCPKSRRVTRALSSVSRHVKRGSIPGLGRWMDRLLEPPPKPIQTDTVTAVVEALPEGTEVVIDGQRGVMVRNRTGELSIKMADGREVVAL